MRLVWIGLLACALELGWLVLWPVSAALSQSPAFTSDYLATHPRVAALVEAWPVPHPAGPLGASLGQPELITPVLILGGLLVYLSATYVAALVAFSRSAGAMRGAGWMVLGGAVVFQLTLQCMPGLFSQDVFGYIAYGRIATTYGLNPYVWPPSAFAKDPVVAWVADVWQTYACPYGPLWVDLQSALARSLDRLSLVDQALAYRAVASVLQLLNVGLVWRVVGRLTPLGQAQRVAAVAALAWNPLVLFELVGDAHNDVLMVTLSLLAVLVLVTDRSALRGPVVAGLCFTLGALVKYLSGAGLVWTAIAAASRAHTWRSGLFRAALIGFVSTCVAVGVAAPWLELPDSLDPLLTETTGVGYVNSVSDHLALTVVGQVELVRAIERTISPVMFTLYLVWELRRVWADPYPAGVVRATARSSLVYVLIVTTSVQAWYFALPLALAVLLGLRSPIARVALGYSLLSLPAFYTSYYLRDLTPAGVWAAYGLIPLLTLVSLQNPLRLLRHLVRRSPLDESPPFG